MGKNSGKSAKRKAKRKPRGRPFRKGAPSPNPAGRPKKDFDIVTRCKELTPDIIERYARMGANAISSADVSAGKVVIAYAHDLPRARAEITGAGGGPVKISYDDVRDKLAKLAEDIARDSAEDDGAEDDDDDGSPPNKD